MQVFILSLVIALVPLVGWLAYLIFCAYVVSKTKDPKSLKYAAKAARAYREGMASAVAEALAKVFGGKRRGPGHQTEAPGE